MRVPSRANLRMTPIAASRFVRQQRSAVAIGLMQLLTYRPKTPVLITMERCQHRLIKDDDNLPHALKSVRDEIAAWIGLDDGDPRLSWKVVDTRIGLQCVPFVRVTFEPMTSE